MVGLVEVANEGSGFRADGSREAAVISERRKALGRDLRKELRQLGDEQLRVGLLPEGQLWAADTRPRHLSTKQYLLVVGAGMALTAGQLLVLPRVLGAKDFAVAVLGISAMQAFFVFGDLGFGRLSDNTLLPKEQRDHLRTLSLVTAGFMLVLGSAVCAVAMTFNPSPVLLALPLGAATAVELYSTQLRAQAFEAQGDEVGGALRHFLWQNMPKVGLIAGALLTRSAIGSMLAGLAVAVATSPPKACSLPSWDEIPRLWKQWLPTFLSVVAPFILTWADTYFVAIHNGLVSTASYALIYRVLGAVTYLYLPFGSVLLSRLNVGDHRAAWTVPLLSVLVTVPALACLCVAVGILGPQLLEEAYFDRGLILPLALMYLFANLGYLFGTHLYGLGRFRDVLVANSVGAALAIGGHLVFTIRSTPIVAARVSLASITATAALQGFFGWLAWRDGSRGRGLQARAAHAGPPILADGQQPPRQGLA